MHPDRQAHVLNPREPSTRGSARGRGRGGGRGGRGASNASQGLPSEIPTGERFAELSSYCWLTLRRYTQAPLASSRLSFGKRSDCSQGCVLLLSFRRAAALLHARVEANSVSLIYFRRTSLPMFAPLQNGGKRRWSKSWSRRSRALWSRRWSQSTAVSSSLVRSLLPLLLPTVLQERR